MTPPVLLQKEPVTKSPRKAPAPKTQVDPSEDWLSSTFGDLGVDPGARQAAKAVQKSVSD
jgi:hypothetical protein